MNLTQRGFRGFVRYMEHLAGDQSANLQHGSDVVDWLRSSISDDKIAALTAGQHDRVERAVSAVLGALRVHVLVRQGWTLRSWRPTHAKQPGVRNLDGYDSRFYEWRHDLPGWRDHPYRLLHTDSDGKRRERFVSEPYDLDEDGLRSLVTLIDEGWRVRVDADWSLHYPGSTLRVVISKRADE